MILKRSIVAGVLQGDTLALNLFIICLDYVLRTSIDKIRERLRADKQKSRRYPAKTITDADYADDIAILANTPNQAETLLHSLERAAAGIGLYVNAHKTEYMCYNQTGDISTLDGTPLKLVDKFTYLGSSVESTEKDIDTRLTKAWTAINWLSIIWKSDLTDKMKRGFFQAAAASILLYGCTTWTLTKRLEKKVDGNYTRMLRAILNKSWRQHPTRHQLFGHLTPITKTIQAWRTRHAGHCWRSRDELIRDVLLWTPTHGRAKTGRPARTYIQQLFEDSGCSPEDLPELMNDREKRRERVRSIRATSTTWWWWWILYTSFLKQYLISVRTTRSSYAHTHTHTHTHTRIYIYIYIYIYIVRIRQHIPRVILSKGRQKSGHSQTMDSDIGEYLLTINTCRTNYEDDCFSVLHRARDKIHLKILEAIYIAINLPHPRSVQTIKHSYFEYFGGTVGDWGDLIFFLTSSP